MTTTNTTQQPTGQSRRWPRTELAAMSHAEMEKNLPEIEVARSEGRIDWNS